MPSGLGGHSPLLHNGLPRKRNGTHYTILSRGEERNLLPNAVRLEISGGGQLCGSNELTPTRNTITHFSSLSVSALPLGEGNHSPHLNNRTKNVTKSQSLNQVITQKCNR